MMVGSAGFMAPEQVVVGHLGLAADIFVWGVTIGYAATGHSPFGIGDTKAILYRVLYADPDISTVPDSLKPLVQAALNKDPQNRPDAHELLDQLTRTSSAPSVPVPERLDDSPAQTALSRTWQVKELPSQSGDWRLADQQATTDQFHSSPTRVDEPRASRAPAGVSLRTPPVTIYLSEAGSREQVEAAVEGLLLTAGLRIDSRDDPVIGSWFRRMRATAGNAANSRRRAKAFRSRAHIADTHLVLTQDAGMTATLLQNLGPVIASLQPTKDAVVRVGTLLIVKADWVVNVHQLTAAQQVLLNHQPQHAATTPREIITALGISSPDGTGSSRPARPVLWQT